MRYFFFSIISLPLLLPMAAEAASKQLQVPFTPQAPHAIWIEPWENACEETSLLMVDEYYRGNRESKLEVNYAKKRILEIFRYKEAVFGWSLDENSTKIDFIANQFLYFETTKKENPTIEEMKKELDEGRPIIHLSYGKALKNPHFQGDGPPYHAIVLSGYDDAKQVFYTEEPGTRYGNKYAYSYETMMNSMHDFIPNNTQNGKKVVLFTAPLSEKTKNNDLDKDSLGKLAEIEAGTSLLHKDTDGDGFWDGIEVNSGYSPLVNERKIGNGSLIKKQNSPAVYLIENNKKRVFLNGHAFISRGYDWKDITIVSERFIDQLPEGKNLT